MLMCKKGWFPKGGVRRVVKVSLQDLKFFLVHFQMGRLKVKRGKSLFLSRTKPLFYRRCRQNLQDFVQIVQSPLKSLVKKKPKCSSSPRKTIGSKIHTPKGKFQFPKKVGSPMNKHSKLGTPKSKVPRLF